MVFVVATVGLRIYLTWITSTGYTYGALATPIAFLLFAFFGGFAIMLGAEFNAAIQEEWPAPTTHASRLRRWLKSRTQADRDVDARSTARRMKTSSRRRSAAGSQLFLSCS